MMHARSRMVVAVVGASIVLSAIAIPWAATATPAAGAVAELTPTPTPSATTPADPYAVHDHVPGDADSDPTWVWVAGGIFVLIIGAGLAASIASARGAARRGR